MKPLIGPLLLTSSLLIFTACDKTKLTDIEVAAPSQPIGSVPELPATPIDDTDQSGPTEKQTLYHTDVNWRFIAKTGSDLWPNNTQFIDRFEQDGRLTQRFYRLSPKAESQPYLIDFNYIDVTRQYTWQTTDGSIVPVESCYEEVRNENEQSLTVEVCQQEITKGTTVPVTIEDNIYIATDASGEPIVEPVNSYYRVPKVETSLPIERAISLSRRETVKSCTDLSTGKACDYVDNTDPDDVSYYKDLPESVQTLLKETDVHSSRRSYWQAAHDHGDAALTDIAKAMQTVAEHGKIDHSAVELLLNYVRAHNYFTYGNDSYTPTAATAMELHKGLQAISQMEGFFSTSEAAAITHEGYAVAIQGQNFNQHFRDSHMAYHFETALKMVKFHADSSRTIVGDWNWGNAVFQTLGIIDYTADQASSADIYQLFTSQRQTVINNLLSLGYSEVALWGKANGDYESFVLENIIDALTRVYRLEKHGNNQADAELLLPQLDSTLLAMLQYHKLDSSNTKVGEDFLNSLSISLATYYAKWTDREASDFCAQGSDFGPYCQPLDEAALFDAIHECSTTLRLKARANAMTLTQKQQVCETLNNQEHEFHEKMQTNNQPVADDLNTQLEIVIFASSSDWKTYGGPLYNVSTDNGGIYIEGNPAKPGNQARFFAYIAEWLPNFAIWNLEHEYVHYLDGRYNLYGPFMHYPENRTTWWSEGIAEYIAHGTCFNRGLDTVANESTPSLQSILYLTYNSGANMVYSWSYTAHRYLHDNGLESTWLDMARALRQSDRDTAMTQYQAILDDLITYHSITYQQWIDNTLRPEWKANPTCDSEHASHVMGQMH